MAPSAINKQPWKFYVLTDQKTIMRYSGEIKRAAARHFLKAGPREILKNSGSLLHFPKGLRFLAEEDPVFHGAPVVIFITSPRSNEWSDLDVGMCAQNIMLAAKSLGLASCPVGFGKFIEEAPSFHELGVGKSERVNISLVIGTGDEEPEVHERKRDNAVYL